MSNLEHRKTSVAERDALDAKYRAARARIEKNRQVEAGQAGALMFAALAYQETLETNTLFATASHWAKLFCIAALFVIPNLLVLRVLF